MGKNTFQQGQSTLCALRYILYGLINPVSNLNYYGPREAASARTPFKRVCYPFRKRSKEAASDN